MDDGLQQSLFEDIAHAQSSSWQQLSEAWDQAMVHVPDMPTWRSFLFEPWSVGSGFVQHIVSYVLGETVAQGRAVVHIVLLCLLAIVLHTWQSAFEHTTVSKVAFALSYIVIAVLVMHNVVGAVSSAQEAITSMVHVMYALLPLLMTLLVSLGSVLSASVLHPLALGAVYGVSTAISQAIFPALTCAAALHIVSTCSERFSLSWLARSIQTLALGALLVVMAVFVGIVSVHSVGGGVRDGLAIKTAKTIASSTVPVVGRVLSDATDVVFSGALLITNSIGIAGVVLLMTLCAFPALKVVVLAWMHYLAAAVLQPFGQTPILYGLRAIGGSLMAVAAVVAAVGLMCFLTIAMIIAGANVGMMMR
ncbi:MAG: stage III sporulation protein AE [Paenibacillaceae bacterium]|nr:stage III sporulation protein AE [Paenibacillaceae bacterium]